MKAVKQLIDVYWPHTTNGCMACPDYRACAVSLEIDSERYICIGCKYYCFSWRELINKRPIIKLSNTSLARSHQAPPSALQGVVVVVKPLASAVIRATSKTILKVLDWLVPLLVGVWLARSSDS